jgi:hypothetical protein
MSADAVIIGLKPWLPPPLSKSEWWTAPVPAERLAALRIGVGLTLLLDVLGTYLPHAVDLLGDGSVSQTAAFAHPLSVTHRLLLLPVSGPLIWMGLLLAWAVAGFLLTIGCLTRCAAALAWYLSASLVAINPMLHNAGDQVRTILLLLLIGAPSDAVWSVRRYWHDPAGANVLIYPWPLRLLFVQMAAIYFMNGLFKVLGDDWRSGEAMVAIMGDAGWVRWPIVDLHLPKIIVRMSAWVVVAWELAFPLLMRWPRCRAATLWIGVAFHISTALTMRVGMFPAYMLCLYLMFVPWERWK